METLSYVAASANGILAATVVLRSKGISRVGAFALGVAAALGLAGITSSGGK
jgi:hypothetical protein